ncbi:MAG: hypothetical protein RJA70_861 [Pseudomonadota bacterium]|jgi:hypothetical protein
MALLGLLGTGCPLYDDQDCAQNRGICAGGFSCDVRSGTCVKARSELPRVRSCRVPGDCAALETCDVEGQCRLGSCAIHGCIEGYACRIVRGVHTCVLTAPAPDAADTDASAK